MFKSVEINRSGNLLKTEILHFGGEFHFFDKLKIGGTGSPKIIYEKGIEDFDKKNDVAINEPSFVSFELLRDGLILRLNKRQKIECVGIEISNLKKIELLGYRIQIRQKKLGRYVYKIVHRGELKMIDNLNDEISFSVISSNFKSIIKYFNKPRLKEIFSYTISTKPPEKDYAALFEFLDLF